LQTILATGRRQRKRRRYEIEEKNVEEVRAYRFRIECKSFI